VISPAFFHSGDVEKPGFVFLIERFFSSDSLLTKNARNTLCINEFFVEYERKKYPIRKMKDSFSTSP